MTNDPVNIDIQLRQNVETEADKAARGIDKMSAASQAAKKELDKKIELQRATIARLKKELEPLQSAFEKLDFGANTSEAVAQRQELSRAVGKLRTELEGEEAVLRDLEKANEAVAGKQELVMRQIRTLMSDMAHLRITGQKNTDMYREKAEQLGVLSTAMRELKKEQELLSTGGSDLAGFRSGLQGLFGTMSAGAGVMGLLNVQSEDYARIQTRIQSLMAITIGLQQVHNTLHQTSAFRIQAVARVKQGWAALIGFVNTKLKLSIGL